MKAATRKAYSDGCADTHKQVARPRQEANNNLNRRLSIALQTIDNQRSIIAELTIDANKWRAKLAKDRKYHAAKRDAAKVPAKLKARAAKEKESA